MQEAGRGNFGRFRRIGRVARRWRASAPRPMNAHRARVEKPSAENWPRSVVRIDEGIAHHPFFGTTFQFRQPSSDCDPVLRCDGDVLDGGPDDLAALFFGVASANFRPAAGPSPDLTPRLLTAYESRLLAAVRNVVQKGSGERGWRGTSASPMKLARGCGFATSAGVGIDSLDRTWPPGRDLGHSAR